MKHRFWGHTRSALLILLALLVGLLLPELIIRAQDVGSTLEAAEIEPVTLSEESGLLNAEKINMLANESCELTALSAGKHQDAATLSQSVWNFLEQLSYQGAKQLLQTETTEQKTHAAWLVTLDTQAFIVWEVLFVDALDNQLRIYIDDESSMPLGLSYTSGKPVASDGTAPADIVLEVFNLMNGLYTAAAVEQDAKTETTEYPQTSKVPEETARFLVTLNSSESGKASCTFPIEIDATGFRLNWVN